VPIWKAGEVLFAIDVSERGSWSIIAVTGELELGTAPRVRQQLVSLVGDGRRYLVIDLSGVEFIDSLGLGVVVSGLKRVRAHGGELRVAGLAPRVRALFDLTRLDEIIGIYDTVDAAIEEPIVAEGDGDGG
jgi:anti-sigma B factor antagonist